VVRIRPLQQWLATPLFLLGGIFKIKKSIKMGNSQIISEQRSHAMQNYVDFDGQDLDVKSQPIQEEQPKKSIPDYVSLIGIAAIIGLVMWTISEITKD
jgi:hypothetical protein